MASKGAHSCPHTRLHRGHGAITLDAGEPTWLNISLAPNFRSLAPPWPAGYKTVAAFAAEVDQRAGSRVLVTVTSPAEAIAACAEGTDALVVQGPAAGGVDGPDAVRALREAGAAGVAVGTLLLRTDEAGTSANHRAGLGEPAFTQTVITRVFTGRPARALLNSFTDRHSAATPVAYPAAHFLTKDLRGAAGMAGDLDRVHLWAGTGWSNARPGPVADVIAGLSVGAVGH